MIRELWEKYDDLILEIGRIFVLAGISAVVTYLISLVSPFAINGTTDATIWFLILTALKGIDRWLHEKTSNIKGLTRF